ncbi:Carboxymuconolactone decarboxylase [Solidesulfovibrio carbinoliphilus subsp. oakridgensis]|uniref:Carboxymuconolactone decarboxylase n=1 Tax=Solidesulfovibrio carbinoliphilus subsp. oakridgensis TaxID=694327 RepID=G7QAC9_9BACT|nr:carboxymuconolactone decarboxylase family protein [Solidesulfovibrio carbinoliphilus]EHJ48280.1 Carboxymuconolactone decarboxylase [Solidesulfovibrio carbinoliphilus subsp. oakridgensis]
MTETLRPRHYETLFRNFPEFMRALDGVAQAVRGSGPLDEKTIQLVQLGAAAALGSETAVASHARRAGQAGASPAEINQSLLALTTTIGFPSVAAALKWVQKHLEE